MTGTATVNYHVALNLRFNQAPIDTTLKQRAKDLRPDFH